MLYEEKKSVGIVRAEDVAIDTEPTKAPLTMTMWAGVVLAATQSLNYGFGVGVVNLTAPTVRAYFNIEGPEYEATWGLRLVASLMAVGGIIGGILGGPMCTKLGPKRTQLVNNLFLVVAVCLQSFAQNITMLMAGRVFTGIAAGILCVAVPMRVGESSPTHARGAFGFAHQLAITVGILIINLLSLKLFEMVKVVHMK